ncbi:hypothetical protein [Anaerovorax odorimutans]|uniref:hypothetical protein n=1 Tax=Anaerovorax odorimutans TaxID=109327 RepID=UPI000414E79F|nr:hypothetical protein [Anaerovorax odorimutans]
MKITLMVYALCILCFSLGVLFIINNNFTRWRIDKNNYQYKLKDYINKLKTSKYIKKIKNEKKDKEIYEAIAFLRNMTTLGKGSMVSADFVIQQLASHKGILQPIYIRMLSYLRLNKKEEAAIAFYENVGTPISKDFARLLIQWDEMDPKDLIEILISYQKNIKEEKITLQKKRDEIISDLIYFPVVINVIVIFINFIYVAYFLDQKEILQMFI